MCDIISYKEVQDKVMSVQGQNVLIDRDVAGFYGVETKAINQAVKNNPDKFPPGYVFKLTKQEKNELVKNFDRFNTLKHSIVMPSAFTEKGLYMLATILKSQRATQATIAIVETFAKMRELSRTVEKLADAQEDKAQKSLLQKSGELLSDLLDKDLEVTGKETTVEVNFAVMKITHTIKRQKKQ